MRLIFLSIFLLANSILANASEKVINFDDFVHLSLKKQIQTIKLVHSFLIEYEHQVQYESANTKNKLKYHSYLKFIDSFISSAHAEESVFDKVPTSLKCYYGGWISFTKTAKNGRPYCVHPKRLSLQDNKKYLAKKAGIVPYDEGKFKKSDIYNYYIGNVSKKYKSYFGGQKSNKTKTSDVTFENGKIVLRAGSDNCSAKESIPCNPEIYGQYKGQTLCIKAGNNLGVNAGYLCTKALDHIEKVDNPEFIKTMEKIVKDGISDSGNNLFDTLKAMYDTCLCGGDSTANNPKHFQGSINPEYANKIFTSRTCAGILAQTQLINDFHHNACKAGDLGTNDEQKKWIGFLNKTNLLLSSSINDIRSNSKLPKGLNLLSASKKDVDELFTADHELFKDSAMANYNLAIENNLCPVLNTKPILIASFDEVTNTVVVKASPNEINISSLQATTLNHKGIDGKKAASSELSKGLKDDSNKSGKVAPGTNTFRFNITRVPDDSHAIAEATYNGSPITSNQVLIPGLNKKPDTEQSLELKNLGYLFDTKKKVLFNKLDITAILKKETLANKKIGAEFLSLAEPGPALINEKDKDNFLIPTQKETVELSALYKKGDVSLTSPPESFAPPSFTCSIEASSNAPAAIEEVKEKADEDEDEGDKTKKKKEKKKEEVAEKENKDKEKKKEGHVFKVTPVLEGDLQIDGLDLSKADIISKLILNKVSAKKGESLITLADYKEGGALQAAGSLSIGKESFEFHCEQKGNEVVPVPEVVDGPKIASCEVKIETEEDDDGKTTLNAKVTYFKDADKKNKMEAPKGSRVTMQWYNHAGKAGKKKKESKADPHMIGEDKKAEKKKTPKKFDDDSEKIEKKYALIKSKSGKSDSPKIGPISIGSKDKTYSVVVKSEDNSCRATASYTVDKEYLKAPNNDPAFQRSQNGGGFQGGGGTIFKGVD